MSSDETFRSCVRVVRGAHVSTHRVNEPSDATELVIVETARRSEPSELYYLERFDTWQVSAVSRAVCRLG